MSGPVDLGQIGGNPAQQAELARQQLQVGGLQCKCGKRIVDQGIQLLAMWKGIIPTPQGPQDGALLIQAVYCARHCPEALAARKEGLTMQAAPGLELRGEVIASRPVPPIEWKESR